jgi:hypothetical protein
MSTSVNISLYLPVADSRRLQVISTWQRWYVFLHAQQPTEAGLQPCRTLHGLLASHCIEAIFGNSAVFIVTGCLTGMLIVQISGHRPITK